MATAAPPDLVSMVSAAKLRATVEKLASWRTRNTNTPEHREAARWIADQYRALPGLRVEEWSYPLHKGRRVVADGTAVNVIATLPGESDRIILVGGHLDTINMQEGADPMTARAPGANDDASGTALALELARVMSTRKWKHTLVFCAFSGEEQGLLGSAALAQRAVDEKWPLDAVFSNDMVGNSQNLNGQRDNRHVRVFSEEITDPEAKPHASRELARWIEWATRDKVKGAAVKLVFRKDRYQRGGDHTPFNNAGFTAVRFVEQFEEYSRQHTDADLPEAMDFDYLANNVRLNLVAMASLAEAASPPREVRIDLRQGHDTTLTWKAEPDVAYRVYWRETTSPTWQDTRLVGETDHVTIPKVSKDDYVFAVGAEGGIPVVAR